MPISRRSSCSNVARFASVVKHSVMALSAALKWHGDGGDGGVNAGQEPGGHGGRGRNKSPPLGSFILFHGAVESFYHNELHES